MPFIVDNDPVVVIEISMFPVEVGCLANDLRGMWDMNNSPEMRGVFFEKEMCCFPDRVPLNRDAFWMLTFRVLL